MNREETIKLLAILRANYPNVKIPDPAATVSSWEELLGEYPANIMFKAARLHMEKSQFFPTPADILREKDRAILIMTPVQTARSIEAPRAKITAIPDGVSEEEFIDGICNSMAELENECWPEPTDDNILGGALPYET